jgi:hypothetical protein
MPDRVPLSEEVALRSSRRGFLARVGAVLLGTAAGGGLQSALRTDEAEAFHFCGHTYTTGSCIHPSGLPRIDKSGYPLRVQDGHPIDDTGRLVDKKGRPVNEHGHMLRDPDGRPLPPAPRTKICALTAKRYGFKPYLDGSWYRCCSGQVRRLWDCCGYVQHRINGDAALTGYCYSGRKVFCVQYYDTKVPC